MLLGSHTSSTCQGEQWDGSWTLLLILCVCLTKPTLGSGESCSMIDSASVDNDRPSTKFWTVVKYQHFSKDIKSHEVTVIPFEIGSNTGYVNRDNRIRLHTLHKFCWKDIKLKKFIENISAIAVLGSYLIFNHINQETWVTSDLILAPFYQWYTMETYEYSSSKKP